MLAMLSLAASCARLGLPCLAAVLLGCCIVGRPLKFDCEPNTIPLLARLLPATAAAFADATLGCLRPVTRGFEGLDGGLDRTAVC
jgi:hypothetical protein